MLGRLTPAFLPLTIAGVAFLLLGTSVHAQADSLRHRDATEDMVRVAPGEGEESTTTPAPDRRDGDIRSFYAKHGQRALRLRLGLVELTRASNPVQPVFALRTNKGRRDVFTFASPGTPTRSVMLNGYGRRVRCAIATTVSYADNLVRLVIPRSCLNRPRWIRTGAGIYVGTEDQDYAHVDDAYLNGRIGDELRLGPRLRR